VTLLLVNLFVSFDDSLYAVKVWPDICFLDGTNSMIAWRLTVVPDFAQSLPVNAGFSGQLTKRNLLIADFTP